MQPATLSAETQRREDRTSCLKRLTTKDSNALPEQRSVLAKQALVLAEPAFCALCLVCGSLANQAGPHLEGCLVPVSSLACSSAKCQTQAAKTIRSGYRL